MYRFYLPTLSAEAAGEVQLPEDQAHHALHVLRLSAGEAVIVFDGQGRHAPGTITQVGKKGVMVKLTEAVARDLEPSPALTIATAVPKADRADWLIEQASQLNVTAVQWLDCDRSVVKPKEGSAKLEKHGRLAIESAKQCQRTHVLKIAAPIPLAIVLKNRLTDFDRVLWLDPQGSVSVEEAIGATPKAGGQQPLRILALIGPEGGWSPREESLLGSLVEEKRVTRIRLTSTILRIETACAALAANVMSA